MFRRAEFRSRRRRSRYRGGVTRARPSRVDRARAAPCFAPPGRSRPIAARAAAGRPRCKRQSRWRGGYRRRWRAAPGSVSNPAGMACAGRRRSSVKVCPSVLEAHFGPKRKNWFTAQRCAIVIIQRFLDWVQWYGTKTGPILPSRGVPMSVPQGVNTPSSGRAFTASARLSISRKG